MRYRSRLPFLLCAFLLPSACATEGSRIAPVETWRKTRPEAGPPPEVHFPDFQKVELANGLQVFVVPEPSLPILSMRFVVKTGSVADPKGKEGLAALTFDMLDEGAGQRNAFELSEAFADLGTVVHTYAGREYGEVSVNALKRNGRNALQLFSEVILAPRFDDAAFEVVQKKALDDLVARLGDPNAVATEIFAKVSYGDHLYGRPHQGDPKSVQKIRPSDAKKFWQQNAGPKNAAVIFAGDITLEEARAWAQDAFGTWRNQAATTKVLPFQSKAKAPVIHIVDFPSTPQTVFRIGHPCRRAGRGRS